MFHQVMGDEQGVLRFIGSVEGRLLGLAEGFGRHLGRDAMDRKQTQQSAVDAWRQKKPPGC
jgi:hypothetical protein